LAGSKGDSILTGSSDHLRDQSGGFEGDEEWPYQPPNTLAYRLLVEWVPRDETIEEVQGGQAKRLPVYPIVRDDVNLHVTAVEIGSFGDLKMTLSDESIIESFSAGTVAEHWRILFPGRLRRAQISMYGNAELGLD
jgi:hypothetical protein